MTQHNDHPPICDYEGSEYQTTFWEQGGRDYEDQVETIALKRLLPAGGRLLLEVGAGAGRNTPRYQGFEPVVLLDYSRTQLRQAQERLGTSRRYIYVAGDFPIQLKNPGRSIPRKEKSPRGQTARTWTSEAGRSSEMCSGTPDRCRA